MAQKVESGACVERWFSHHKRPPEECSTTPSLGAAGDWRIPATSSDSCAYYYNHVRPHQSLNQNNPIPSRKGTRTQKGALGEKNLKLTISF
ncbi:MAG: hypothetical protein QXR19_00345 [Candidatus Jordarchaeaceae archaeon]